MTTWNDVYISIFFRDVRCREILDEKAIAVLVIKSGRGKGMGMGSSRTDR
jgi:hypothetical protein